MYIVTEEKANATLDWIKTEVWSQIVTSWNQNELIPYLLAILVGLIIILVALRMGKMKKKRKPKGGYQNFQGDTWYPDGRIYRKDTKSWEMPDYKKDRDS